MTTVQELQNREYVNKDVLNEIDTELEAWKIVNYEEKNMKDVPFFKIHNTDSNEYMETHKVYAGERHKIDCLRYLTAPTLAEMYGKDKKPEDFEDRLPLELSFSTRIIKNFIIIENIYSVDAVAKIERRVKKASKQYNREPRMELIGNYGDIHMVIWFNQ